MNERYKQIQLRLETLSTVMREIPEINFLGASDTLRQKAETVSYDEGLEISRQLTDILLRYRRITGVGRGMAAPQIGIAKKVFITFLDDKILTYINPVLSVVGHGKNLYREQCISSGITWADVLRPEKVSMEFITSNMDRQKRTADGLIARLWQHEYDHLLGVVNLDKAEVGTIELVSSDPLQEKLRVLKPLS